MKSKGFTLIELAVVLAIIAVLAAVLTPMVTGYLDQARIARAQADTRTIADAFKLHYRDTGRYPIWYTAANFTTGTIAAVGNGKAIFKGPGTQPADANGWTSAATATTTLETWINANYTVVSTTTTFPKAGYRGPYVGVIETDPWGNSYLVNAGNLGSDSSSHSFVISAGPNGTLDTTKDQSTATALTIGSDDVVAMIK